jgi:hypothetical protein
MTALLCVLLPSGCSDGNSPSIAFAPGNSKPNPLTVPDTIDATGTKDVTTDLNAYLASVPDGSVIEFPAGAKYRVEGTVLLRDRRDLTIDGNDALIFATTDGSDVIPPPGGGIAANWPRNRHHIEIKGSSGIVIRDLNVRGANPNAGMREEAYVSALEAQHAFSITGGAADIELDHVRATDVYGDFVYVGGGHGQEWNRNIHIHDSHFERNGRQGIAVTRGQGVLVERNYIGDTRRATFDLEPSSLNGGALEVVIRDNEIGPGRLAFLAARGVGPNISFTVENNILHRGMGTTVKTGHQYRRGPIRIVGNISDYEIGSSSPALEFHRVDGVVVRDNYQAIQGWRDQTFVMACESTGVDIRDNEVPGAGRDSEVLDTCRN